MEDETKGLQSVAEQVDTSICERTTPQPTPDSCEIDRNGDPDPLSRCCVAELICDLVCSVTVVKLTLCLAPSVSQGQAILFEPGVFGVQRR